MDRRRRRSDEWHITYEGDPAFAGALVGVLEEEGLVVEWDPPLETRSAIPGITETILLSMVAAGVYDSLKVGVQRLRKRFASPRVTIDEDDDPDEESAQ